MDDVELILPVIPSIIARTPLCCAGNNFFMLLFKIDSARTPLVMHTDKRFSAADRVSTFEEVRHATTESANCAICVRNLAVFTVLMLGKEFALSAAKFSTSGRPPACNK